MLRTYFTRTINRIFTKKIWVNFLTQEILISFLGNRRDKWEVGQVHPHLIGFRRQGGVRKKRVGGRGAVVQGEVDVVCDDVVFAGFHEVGERTDLEKENEGNRNT